MSGRYLTICTWILFALCVALISYTTHLVFMVVPNEATMGPVQRIFYFHVGGAIACYSAIGTLLIASLHYLGTRSVAADVVAESSAEVALLLCTVVLASGMIWGHSAWNTWFSWEPRLVSFLLLWLLMISYCALRSFGDPDRIGSQCAVLGILGAINVPIIVYSIKLLPNHMHPDPDTQYLKDPLFISTLYWGMGSMFCLQLLLILVRTRIGFLERKISSKE